MADAARRAQMPALFYSRDTVKAGGLMSYSASIFTVNRRAGYLRGAKPADLPMNSRRNSNSLSISRRRKHSVSHFLERDRPRWRGDRI